MKASWSALAWIALGTGAAARQDGPPDFARQIRPLLEARCLECHGPAKDKGQLRLDQRASGLARVVPGDALGSELYRRLVSSDPQERMPQAGGPLDPAQIELLRRWIDAGAAWPAEIDSTELAAPHWAYVAPRRPNVPAPAAGAATLHPLDAFICAALAERQWSLAPPADPATLLRRVSLDLTGLPPSPADLDEFLSDRRGDAYERAVERLLASPAYGERMAQWWLDLARYADTNGYEKDARRSAWPWRDWVIAAFNGNMPYDQFTIRQLAGDLLERPTREDRVATGFQRNTLVNEEGGTDPEEFRVAAVVDRTNVVASVWLSTTLACAQCHDHKFDPLSQREYYQLYAFFDQTTDSGNQLEPMLALPSAEQSRRAALLAERVHAAQVAAARLAARSFAQERRCTATARPSPLVAFEPERAAELARWRAEQAQLRASIPHTSVLEERGERRTTRVLDKGSFLAPLEPVEPGVPAVLGRIAPRADGQPLTRLDLSRWLVSTRNPLAARVLANRLWERLFGRGLVATLDDFGTRGEPPSHPELLDWLAWELVDTGWDVKRFLRLLCTSAVYRQSSQVRPEHLERDPDNLLLARAPRARLEIETLRDQALALAGLLEPTLGGPSVMPPQPDGVWAPVYSDDRWETAEDARRFRRGVYVFWRRSSPYATFTLFDAPSRELSCTRRARSNTPLQALALFNDPAFVECAVALGARARREGGAGDRERAAFLFRLATARAPEPGELDVLLELLEAERTARVGSTECEDQAWTQLASVVLNLDETVTRH
jgi:hypothetical protein